MSALAHACHYHLAAAMEHQVYGLVEIVVYVWYEVQQSLGLIFDTLYCVIPYFHICGLMDSFCC